MYEYYSGFYRWIIVSRVNPFQAFPMHCNRPCRVRAQNLDQLYESMGQFCRQCNLLPRLKVAPQPLRTRVKFDYKHFKPVPSFRQAAAITQVGVGYTCNSNTRYQVSRLHIMMQNSVKYLLENVYT